jgi:hypothetical protein
MVWCSVLGGENIVHPLYEKPATKTASCGPPVRRRDGRRAGAGSQDSSRDPRPDATVQVACRKGCE